MAKKRMEQDARKLAQLMRSVQMIFSRVVMAWPQFRERFRRMIASLRRRASAVRRAG